MTGVTYVEGVRGAASVGGRRGAGACEEESGVGGSNHLSCHNLEDGGGARGRETHITTLSQHN